MYALAISGSPREEGNTSILLKRCLARLEKTGIRTQFISLAGLHVGGCTACGDCFKMKDGTCTIGDDFQPIYDAMKRADIIVVGSPVYFGSASPEMMAVLDRAGFVSGSEGGALSHKLGGPVAVARRAGHNFTYAQLLMWFMINDMIVPGSTYWNVGVARDAGDVQQDTEALTTIDRFADNLVWLARKTCQGGGILSADDTI